VPADINKFHGFAGRVGEQLLQQHGFMYIADKQAVNRIEYGRARGHLSIQTVAHLIGQLNQAAARLLAQAS
jgi:hypothetical protein